MKTLDQTLMDQRVERLLAEVEEARTTAQYWKAEHLAGNAEIEQLRAELAEAQAVIEQMHKFAFDRHDAMLDQVVEGIMKDDSALQQRLAQERERCAQVCDAYADYDHANFADRCAEDIRALEEPK